MDMDEELYTVAGKNLRPFVERYLEELDKADPIAWPMVELIRNPETSEEDLSFFGPVWVAQPVNTRTWGHAGSNEEILLFAVLASFSARDLPWGGSEDHMRKAFEHMRQIGEVEAARRLRAEVVTEATRERDRGDEMRNILLNESLRHDPGKLAAHDQEIAKNATRTLRAAAALDPDGGTDLW
ncbi:hypothetical protein [Streptosporangium sp. NPDC002524]|uniref:hypothetical protein n=1 Tax=Streptosporangium sp. NPDC002524 TaxID=3154537 RepID=UPI003327A605